MPGGQTRSAAAGAPAFLRHAWPAVWEASCAAGVGHPSPLLLMAASEECRLGAKAAFSKGSLGIWIFNGSTIFKFWIIIYVPILSPNNVSRSDLAK